MTDDETRSSSFCDRLRAEVKYLVAGPGVSICDVCIRAARDKAFLARDAATVAHPPCTFCKDTQTRMEHVGLHGRICASCIALCIEILEEQQPPAPLPTARALKN